MNTKLFGIFAFDPANMYRNPVRTYKSRAAADKYADRLLYEPGFTEAQGLPIVDRGYVVRDVR